MSQETLTLLAVGLIALFVFYRLLRVHERLDCAEERLADTRLRLFVWAEIERDCARTRGQIWRMRQIEALFPEVKSELFDTYPGLERRHGITGQRALAGKDRAS